MTVEELISELKKMPGDKEVVFSYGSDDYEFYSEVDEVSERTIRVNGNNKDIVYLYGWEY